MKTQNEQATDLIKPSVIKPVITTILV